MDMMIEKTRVACQNGVYKGRDGQRQETCMDTATLWEGDRDENEDTWRFETVQI